jgi:hypothetical protein
MTSNPENPAPLATGRDVGSSTFEQLDSDARVESMLRVVSADGSTVTPTGPKSSGNPSPLSAPVSSTHISSSSGSLDLSCTPAGLDRPKPERSFCTSELPGNPTLGTSDERSGGLLDTCIEPEPAAIPLESHLQFNTGRGSSPTIDLAATEPVSVHDEGPSSIEMRRSGFDSNLARTIDAWPSLPLHVRETIVTIIEATLNG